MKKLLLLTISVFVICGVHGGSLNSILRKAERRQTARIKAQATQKVKDAVGNTLTASQKVAFDKAVDAYLTSGTLSSITSMKKAISLYVKGSEAQQAIAHALDTIRTGSFAALTSVPYSSLARTVAIGAMQDAVTKNTPPDGREQILQILSQYVDMPRNDFSGLGLDNGVDAQLAAFIDRNIKDPAAAAAIKNAAVNIRYGREDQIDYQALAGNGKTTPSIPKLDTDRIEPIPRIGIIAPVPLSEEPVVDKEKIASLRKLLEGQIASDELSKAFGEFIEHNTAEAWTKVNAAIDKHVKGDAAKAALKDAVKKISGGSAAQIDVGKVASAVAVGAIKDAVSRNLGEKEAKAVNEAIDAYMAGGVDGVKNAAKTAALDAVNKAIDRHVKGDAAKASLKDAVNKISGGNAAQIDVGKVASAVAVGALKDAVSKHLGEDAAKAVNDAIDAYMAGGVDGVKKSAQNTVNATIDKYVKGDDARSSLKNAVDKIMNGEADQIDVGEVARNVATGGIDSWIDKQNWSDKTKSDAKEIVNSFFENGVDGLTGTAEEVIQARLADKIGAENAKKVLGTVRKIVGSGDIDLEDMKIIGGSIGSIVRNELTEKIDKQLNKLAEKYPIIGKFFEITKINGQNIVSGLVKVGGILFGASTIAEGLKELVNMAAESLNDLMEKLGPLIMQTLLNQLSKIAGDLVKKIVSWIKSGLDRKIKDLVDKIKGFIQKLKNTLSEIKKVSKYVIETAEDIQITVKESAQKINDKVKYVFKERQSAPQTDR